MVHGTQPEIWSSRSPAGTGSAPGTGARSSVRHRVSSALISCRPSTAPTTTPTGPPMRPTAPEIEASKFLPTKRAVAKEEKTGRDPQRHLRTTVSKWSTNDRLASHADVEHNAFFFKMVVRCQWIDTHKKTRGPPRTMPHRPVGSR